VEKERKQKHGKAATTEGAGRREDLKPRGYRREEGVDTTIGERLKVLAQEGSKLELEKVWPSLEVGQKEFKKYTISISFLQKGSHC